MKLIPTTLEPLFYLYCALIYNDNKTIRLPSPQVLVAENIVELLEGVGYKKVDMPDHRYQYILSLLQSPNYKTTDQIRPLHIDIIEYIKDLSELEELQVLFNTEKEQVEEHFSLYGDNLDKVTALFNKKFDFKSKYENVYVTRNIGKSGMLIPLEKECYLILGNISFYPNIRNLIHELLHAQLKEVNLKLTDNIRNVINNLPDEVYDNYKKPYTVVEESLVRAMVVLLTKNSDYFENEELSIQDKELVLPQTYFNKLNTDNKEVFNRDYLENLSI